MKYIKCRWLLAMIMSCSLFSCTNLDEEVFDRVDAGIAEFNLQMQQNSD